MRFDDRARNEQAESHDGVLGRTEKLSKCRSRCSGLMPGPLSSRVQHRVCGSESVVRIISVRRVGPICAIAWIALTVRIALRLGHGPDWSNDFTRVASLVQLNGIWVFRAACLGEDWGRDRKAENSQNDAQHALLRARAYGTGGTPSSLTLR
jgi:hypothetical protein